MIEQLPFGRTGHNSSRVIFGAAALGGMRQDKADEVLGLLQPAGVNHIDTARKYGESELRLAPFLAQHRDAFFLATKTGERNGAAARAELEESLQRMGVDSVDLIQLHNLVEDDEWEQAFAPDGVVAAMEAARDEGLCADIGITGHGLRIPAVHLRSLERFDFASVLFPLNYSLMAIDTYRADVEALMAVCEERQVAAQTIKSIARRRWQDDDARKFAWYEPITDPDAIANAVNYVLAQPNVFLNTSSDARLLPLALEAAASPRRAPSDEAMKADQLAQGIIPIFDGGALERI